MHPRCADGGTPAPRSTGPVSRRQPRYQRAKPHTRWPGEATGSGQAIGPERLMYFCAVLEPS